MSNGGDLLRMLMPAVRPVPIPPGSAPAPRNLPIESRSFDSLLGDARQADAGVETIEAPAGDTRAQVTGPTAPGDAQAQATELTAPGDARPAIARLAGIDSIHNVSLRRIIADAAGGR